MRGDPTRGSGSGNDKGDIKNRFGRTEAKTTGKESISIKMEYLCKITREARAEGQIPFFQFGFDNMPERFSADWFALGAETFDVICAVLEAVHNDDLELAKRWLKHLC
jgi:hypothetical protein